MQSAELNSSPDKDNQAASFKIARKLSQAGVDPYSSVVWEKRAVAINDENGKLIYELKDSEAPQSWSQMAHTIVASRYFYGGDESRPRETSVKQLIQRVASTISSWGQKGRYFGSEECRLGFHDELSSILLQQYAAFNSPVWFNVGIQAEPQCSACFILSVSDSIDSLLELQRLEGKLFKWGSGTGSNFSDLRSSKEKLSGGGVPSGPVTFMKAFDAWAGVIKSGGKTRRAAKMQILNVTHPDILEFIACKSKEEKKAWALIDQGYDGGFAVPGGAYESVAFQNANFSVRVSDEFMQALKKGEKFNTRYVQSGENCEALDARSVLKQIAEGTWLCGDPGMQFDSVINKWHTCPASGRINASNPCSEYMHLDNSACNLASINLLKFLRADGSFDSELFRHVVRILIVAQDILIDNSSYPTAEIRQCARDFRQLGLGYANLGALLMNLGLAYDSDQGRALAASITSLMTAEAYLTSAKLAAVKGAFHGYQKNKTAMLQIIEMHLEKALKLKNALAPDLEVLSKEAWKEALQAGKLQGFRNSQTTVLAPTGTISFLMDCDTTGIEPDISLVKYKKLAGGGYLKIVNNSVLSALQKLGYSEASRRKIVDYVHESGTIEGAPEFKAEHLPVFDCAFKPAKGTRSISYKGHIKMMGAVQPFISGAISKTVNLPKETGVDEICQIYQEAWELGLKAVALYRDGSKRTQPLNTSTQESTLTSQPTRRRLPAERDAVTHKFDIAGLEGYITVGLYPDKKPGEIFMVVAKEGSTLSGMMDAFATSISMALQYGVPLKDLVKKFSHMRFEPSGFTKNPELPIAKSIIDYVFRWLGSRFLSLPDKIECGLVKPLVEQAASKPNPNGSGMDPINSPDPGVVMTTFQNSEDAPPCTACGSSMMVRQAGCYVCLNCGAQGGCG